MKPLKYLLLALLLASCAEDKGVYICTGRTAKRYHKTENCQGLSRCSGEVRKVTIDEAKAMHRTPCHWCYK